MTAPPDVPSGPYTVTTHDGEEPFGTFTVVSIDAARAVARLHAGMGMVAEVRSQREDYRELYEPERTH